MAIAAAAKADRRSSDATRRDFAAKPSCGRREQPRERDDSLLAPVTPLQPLLLRQQAMPAVVQLGLGGADDILIGTGDKVRSIEGIFSGTLSYLFNNFKAGARFSEIVAEAKASGYTEPDPRDDLSGTDVARKVANLARESGLELELSDIPVRSLVPKELESCETSEEFMRVRKLF